MILTNTRLLPPWTPEDMYLNTFLVKDVRVYLTPVDAPPPGVLNVELAREYMYMAPTIQWVNRDA